MKRIYIPIILAIIIFSSCSTYKNSQTPDDVYYSPGTQKESVASSSNSNGDYYSTPNDQYIHMRVQDPDRWSYFDDYNYDYYGAYSPMGYSPYYGYGSGLAFGLGLGFGYYSPFSFWNSYYTWNSFYNPYYGGIVVVNPKIPSSTTYTRLSTFNPSSYTNNTYSRSNARATNNYQPYSYSQTIRNNYNNTNNFSTRSMSNRPYNNYNNNNNTMPSRSYTPSSSFGGGGGARSGGGGGGGFSRPHR